MAKNVGKDTIITWIQWSAKISGCRISWTN